MNTAGDLTCQTSHKLAQCLPQAVSSLNHISHIFVHMTKQNLFKLSENILIIFVNSIKLFPKRIKFKS